MEERMTETGIVDISVQVSQYYCDVKELAKYFGMEEAKLTVGLGLKEATACALNEDPVTLGLSAIKKLLERNNLSPKDVGRLEVGTESNWDASKSFKTYFMNLFEENKNISGCDTTNACYGGTNALLNAIYWTESSFWDGRYAIVVCTDACLYNDRNLVPLAGSAACAILVGKNPVLKFLQNSVSHFFENTYDFSKPRKNYPYPFLDGKKSVEIYKKAFSALFTDLKEKSKEDFFDHICFHTPYPRLPEKICKEFGISTEKVQNSLLWSKKIGNPYTASLYVSLACLLTNSEVILGEKILLFSFGSGMASSIFILKKVKEGIFKENIFGERLNLNAEMFVNLLSFEKRSQMKEEDLNKKQGFVVKEENEAGRVYEYLN